MTTGRGVPALAAAIAAYAVLLVASLLLLGGGSIDDERLRVAITLLPMPAAAATVAISIRAFASADELEQRIRLMGLAVSFLGTLVVTLSWGFLENVGVERLSGFVVFGLLVALYIAGTAAATRRYR